MVDIIKTCYEAIKRLAVPRKDKGILWRELAEFGFTDELKKKLLNYLDRDLAAKRKLLKDLKSHA